VTDGVCIIVPAFNEASAIAGVLGELRAAWPNVVVVDDGSEDGTAAVAEQAGVTVLRHVVNRGQGAALQTGFAYALRRGAQYIVTFDSDGQHDVADIARLLEPLRADRADVALGSRFLGDTEQIPRLRRLVLRLAVAFTRVSSGADLTDTHNGLRAFTRRAASKIDIRLDRMAHASELLDQIVSRSLRYVEVPVHIRYTSYSRGKGQSSMAAWRIIVEYVLGRWLR
jgi:glycosyltransferase involved in cell wall biosynthesis